LPSAKQGSGALKVFRASHDLVRRPHAVCRRQARSLLADKPCGRVLCVGEQSLKLRTVIGPSKGKCHARYSSPTMTTCRTQNGNLYVRWGTLVPDSHDCRADGRIEQSARRPIICCPSIDMTMAKFEVIGPSQNGLSLDAYRFDNARLIFMRSLAGP